MRCLLVTVAAVLLAHPAHSQLATPNERGVTFCHVHLSVTDLDLHKNLWTDLFDGVLVEKEGFTAVRVPGALVFLTEKEPTAPSPATALDHFGFKVRDVESILAEWRALGYEADSVFTNVGGVAGAYLMMPNGARLELEEDSALAVKAEMNHLHFLTPQYEALPAWYADLFGAAPPPGSDPGTTTFLPGASLIFGDSDAARTPTEDTAIDHIGFEVEEMDPFAEMLRAKGVEFVFGPRFIERLDLWVAFFNDPSGVLVEVSEGLDEF